MVSRFGKEFILHWPDEKLPKYSEFQKNLLKKCVAVTKPSEIVKTSEIITNSQNFPIEFPINTCRVQYQPEQRHKIIEEQINSAYPLIHERAIWLYLRFLEHKIKYGNSTEKNVYSNLDLIEFVHRLLTKRCVTFFQKYDKYLLLSKETGTNGHTTVGSLKEKSPLFLKNCLSYDEIKLSALLSVSSHTEFINNGNRQNQGVVEKNKSNIELSGVIIGLIGARLVKRNFMEAQDIIISENQNTKENGYGVKDSTSEIGIKGTKNDYRQMWNDFYGELDYIYKDIKIDNERFNRLNANEVFDSVIMKKRYTISFDTLLLDADARAFNAKKQAYIHVVGIGLGVWKCWKEQEKIFLATFAERIKILLPKLNNISIIHFSYFEDNGFDEIKNGAIFKSKTHPNGGIKILISKRNPHQKLQPELNNYLPVISYAWDGNALPGNEFWLKYLKSTGDSAAACSTLITELHNPHINTKRVNGNNLHVASEEFGIIHISEFADKILKKL